MAANLNRKAISLCNGQSLLTFGTTKKQEVIYIEREVELRALEFEAEVFKIEVSDQKGGTEIGLQTQIEYVEELKEQQPIEKQNNFECNDCQNFFSTEQSLKRHIKEIHSGKAKIFFKHDKVDGRYQCMTCMKSYIHSAKLKDTCKSIIQVSFQCKIKRLKYLYLPRESLKEKLKRQKRYESMNQPVGNTFLACFQERAMYIPALNAADFSSCIKYYFNINVPSKAKLIVVDEFAYKVYPFSYLIKNEQYQNEFVNENVVLRDGQKRDCKNLLKLDGVILGYGFILRLKKYEMTLRDYLYQNRYPDDLNDILSDMIQELHELGYVHRGLKPKNVMLNLCPLEVVVIDFNRALRQEIATLAKVLETSGYFPIREKWTNGSVQWDVWAVVAIILESGMESMSQFGTMHEKQSISLAQKHIKQEDVCEEIKSIVEMIIVRAPSYSREFLDDILEELQRARLKKYNKDKQIKFF